MGQPGCGGSRDAGGRPGGGEGARSSKTRAQLVSVQTRDWGGNMAIFMYYITPPA